MTEKDTGPDLVDNPFDGDALQGPELRVKFKNEDSGPNELFQMSTPGFPPFIVVVFNGPDDAHFRMLQSIVKGSTVSAYMMASVEKHLKVVSDFNALQNLLAVAKKNASMGIVTVGKNFKLPPDFDSGQL